MAAGTPLAEASARVGFADQSHLTRWFSRYYGITPGVFRAAGEDAVPLDGAGVERRG
ncbi:helix-turn-helix domain-containing protein [Nocardiopsis halotolerans]|uniref:helix-turn-helix domain-containing protein n=1 Tax=Nocardiopsis halotolerans TaxID=124252 RepID=UPI0023A9F7E4|nr:helix-turn-helix domain-containing protein [Nocardiopsis halotolerans]